MTTTGEARPVLGEGEQVRLGDLARDAGDDLPERDRVEPFLAALVQAEHLNLLVGAGLTTALGHIAGHDGGSQMSATLKIPGDGDLTEALEVAAQRSASSTARGVPNLEDRIRVATAAAEGLKNIGDERADAIDQAIAEALGQLRHEITEAEAAIADAASKSVDDAATAGMSLRGVLSTFLGAFAGRVPTRDRAHVFTTNYDRVIEWGIESAGLRVVDRFVGSLRPIFRSSRLEVDFHYSPPGTVRDPRHLDGVLRVTKLHGSLDWAWDASTRQVVREPIPFGHSSDGNPGELLVYPNAAKDVETTLYPYADLFRDFAAATCRPHAVLVTYGYSFGDDHINRIIQDMLSIPSTHLLIISYDDPANRIARFVEAQSRLGQVSSMIGPSMAGLPALVGSWLPWPSADFLLDGRARVERRRGHDGSGDASADSLGSEESS